MRAHRMARIRRSRPIRHRCRRVRWSPTRRQRRPSRWCRRAPRHCQTRRPIRTRRLRRPVEDMRRQGSRRRNKRLCRARSRDTKPDSARSLPCRHRRSVRPPSRPRRRCRLRVRHLQLFRLLRRHSIHHRRPGPVWLSSRILRPPATI